MIADALKCKLYDAVLATQYAKWYGVDCANDLQEIADKSSAYLWALNSGCELPESLICNMEKFIKKLKLYVCDPTESCITTYYITCTLGIEEVFEDPSCTLPIPITITEL